jgi:hypothetical protein
MKTAQYRVRRSTTDRAIEGQGATTRVIDAESPWEAVKAIARQFKDPHRIVRGIDNGRRKRVQHYKSQTASGLPVRYRVQAEDGSDLW